MFSRSRRDAADSFFINSLCTDFKYADAHGDNPLRDWIAKRLDKAQTHTKHFHFLASKKDSPSLHSNARKLFMALFTQFISSQPSFNGLLPSFVNTDVFCFLGMFYEYVFVPHVAAVKAGIE